MKKLAILAALAVMPAAVMADGCIAAKAATPIAITGSGTDAQWAKVAWTSNYMTGSVAAAADVSSKFKIMFDDTKIYYLIEQTYGPTAKRYFMPNCNADQLQAAYYDATRSASTGVDYWTDAISLWFVPKGATTTDGKAYQAMPYKKTNASGVWETGDDSAYMFGSNNSNWGSVPMGVAQGALHKGNYNGTDKVILEGSIPFTCFNVAALNPSGTTTLAPPVVGNVWYLKSTRAAWLTSDTGTASSGGSQWPETDPATLTFDFPAGVSDWSQF